MVHVRGTRTRVRVGEGTDVKHARSKTRLQARLRRAESSRPGDDGTRVVIYGELRVLLVRLHRPRVCVLDKTALFS